MKLEVYLRDLLQITYRNEGSFSPSNIHKGFLVFYRFSFVFWRNLLLNQYDFGPFEVFGLKLLCAKYQFSFCETFCLTVWNKGWIMKETANRMQKEGLGGRKETLLGRKLNNISLLTLCWFKTFVIKSIKKY